MKKKSISTDAFDTSAEKIVKTEYSEEMRQSFLDYSMSVLVARAVPDIRDGLKPVHRRILYTMKEIGFTSDKPYKKCANAVGTTLGYYHAHGDASVYDALVNLTHDFSLNVPLIDAHGNFGSIEGDAYASYRYTECRLEKFTEETLLKNLDKNIVDFVPNFDNSREEPSVLPAKLPNVLINGTNGIAVGTTTSTPPHNLHDVIETYKCYLKNKNVSIEELVNTLNGPDFPTGGIIVNKSELPEIYKTGQGKIRVRGKVIFEQSKGRGDHDKLVITEVPFTMVGLGIEKFLSDVADLAKSRVLPEISDILNQTTATGVRLVLELKSGSDIERIKNILYKKTKLEDTFPVNMLYVVNGIPKTLNLKEIMEEFYKFNSETLIRKYNSILQKQKETIEIKTGLISAIDVIDTIIEVLRGSNSIKIAKDCLTGKDTSKVSFKTKSSEKIAKKFSFTELQAQAILDMKLSRLINLELNVLIKEKNEAEKLAKKCEKILSSEKELIKEIITELDLFDANYSRKRRTSLTNSEIKEFALEDTKETDVYIACDKFGYIKLYDTATYNRNKEAIDENAYTILSKSTSSIFIFTNKGNVHQIKMSEIPLCKARDRGTPADNISNYDSSIENIVSVFSQEQLLQNKFILITKNNLIKMTNGIEFVTSRKTITCSKMSNDDELVAIDYSNPQHLIVQSSADFVLRIKLNDIPEQKRNSSGAKCMSLKENEFIKNAYFVLPEQKEIHINGRKIPVSKIKLCGRATVGQKIK